jgi:hypothetical protein
MFRHWSTQHPTSCLTRSLWITYIVADVFINTADKIPKASRLYWKRLSCHIASVSRRVGFILVEPCVFGGHAACGAVCWDTALQVGKVAGSILDGVIGIFHWHNPSGRTIALELTQPLTEISSRNISWGVKAAGAQGWQPYHIYVPIVLKSGNLNLLEPSGPVQACNGIALHFILVYSTTAEGVWE